MSLETELAAALDRHYAELRTNTPSDVLSAHLVASLRLFEDSILRRAKHPLYNPGRVDPPATVARSGGTRI